MNLLKVPALTGGGASGLAGVPFAFVDGELRARALEFLGVAGTCGAGWVIYVICEVGEGEWGYVSERCGSIIAPTKSSNNPSFLASKK